MGGERGERPTFSQMLFFHSSCYTCTSFMPWMLGESSLRHPLMQMDPILPSHQKLFTDVSKYCYYYLVNYWCWQLIFSGRYLSSLTKFGKIPVCHLECLILTPMMPEGAIQCQSSPACKTQTWGQSIYITSNKEL